MSIVGLHALARRIERGRPNDDSAVLVDLKALDDGWRATIARAATSRSREKSGGKWIGSVTAVEGVPVPAVRTYLA